MGQARVRRNKEAGCLLLGCTILAALALLATPSLVTPIAAASVTTRTLTSPNGQPLGEFGTSVAISDSIVVVGAPLETADGLSDAGHVYAFNASTGKLLGKGTSPNAQSVGQFGFSVAASGVVVVVGANLETANGVGSAGHAYIFA